jgi:hypothetical protein
MKLSELTTPDQAVLALARQGYRKVEDKFLSDDLLQGGAQGVFEYELNTCPHCSTVFRCISVIPSNTKHGTDAGIGVRIQDDETLAGWCFWECYAGTTKVLIPTEVELDQLGPAIDAWQNEVEAA